MTATPSFNVTSPISINPLPCMVKAESKLSGAKSKVASAERKVNGLENDINSDKHAKRHCHWYEKEERREIKLD